MEITIDLSRLLELSKFQPGQLWGYLFIQGGWLVFVIAILVALFYIRLFFLRKKYLLSIKQNLLAIDIPKDNEQTVLAVEQIFAQLYGIKSSITLWEKYWLGKTQLSFSLEIVSIEGYIQFLVRTPEQYRNLVEAAIYAQYPEAEITEVDDYIKLIPPDIHHLKTDFTLWGTEFNFSKYSAYPIKTYKTFEHGLSQSFIDPMASPLEVMSKLGKGEHIGLQIVIAPMNDKWKERGKQIIKKLIGSKMITDEHLGDKFVRTSLEWLEKFSEVVYKLWGDIKTKEDKMSNLPNLVQYLTGGEKIVIEAIQNKLAKLSFATSFRIYYLARKEIFQKGLGVNALIGAINQFNISDQNAFVKYKRLTTDANYFFIKTRIAYKTRRLMKFYKLRSRKGSPEFFLSTEELATLYHFPTITVKAPLLQRTGWKKAKPPTILPIESPYTKPFFAPLEQKVETRKDEETILADKERFIIRESLPGYNFDSNYFEQKFAKNKTILPQPEKQKDQVSEVPANLPFID